MEINRINNLNNPHKKNNDADVEYERQKKKVGKVMEKWRKSFSSKPRTREEVASELYILKAKLEEIGDTSIVLAAIDQVDNAIAAAITTNMLLKNSIMQFLNRAMLEKNRKVKPKHVQFETETELLALPWVDLFTKLPGFTHFALLGHGLMAITVVEGNEDIHLVGYVENGIGLTTITDYKTKAPEQN